MPMFDTVRIRSTPATVAAGYGEAEGTVFGVTTVSLTNVEVIGVAEDDCAINVDFGGALPSAWFQPSLVEVTGQPKTTISLGGADFQRPDGGGEWIRVRPRPWWRFWSRR